MILVKLHHLTANIPFKSCSLRFIVKSLNGSEKNHFQSEVSLLPKIVSKDFDETIKIKPQFLNSKKGDIMLCVVAISEKQVVANIGYIIIDPYQSSQNRRGDLIGLPDQTGYIIYSVVHQFEKKRQIQKEKQQIVEQKVQISDISDLSITQQQSIPPEKMEKNSLINTLNIKIVPNQQTSLKQVKNISENKSISDTQSEQLKKYILQLQQQNKRLKQQTNAKFDNYQLTIELLRAQIVNQEYHLIIKDNTIFQLKNQKKIKKLVGEDYKY